MIASELAVPLGLLGVGGGVLALSTAYYTAEGLGAPGSTGVAAVVAPAVITAGLAAWSKVSARRGNAAADAKAQADYDNWLAQFPGSVQHAIERLTDPWLACLTWSSIGLGEEPNLAKGEPGRWPRLEPSRSSSPADPGVWPVPVGARVRLRMLPGHKPRDYTAKLEELAAVLDVQEVQVHKASGQLICLDIRTVDPLADAIRVPAPPEVVDLRHVTVGRTEDGQDWSATLLHRNWLGVGVQGSGKSGFLRSALIATAPAASQGLVVNLMIDMKFGIEAAAARGLLHKVASREETAFEMLRWLREEVVEHRGQYMEANGIDKHMPTVEAPMIHLIIDEIAEMLDNDKLRKEFMRLLRSILRVGRALAISVSGYSQNPDKETLGKIRDLFHYRIGLRLMSPEQMVMVYGDHGAAARGAANTTIPDQGSEGVAFVVEDGSPRIVRVRAFHATAEDLAAAAEMYPLYPHDLDALAGEKKPDTPRPERHAPRGGGAEVLQMPVREPNDVPDVSGLFTPAAASGDDSESVAGQDVSDDERDAEEEDWHANSGDQDDDEDGLDDEFDEDDDWDDLDSDDESA
jgi:S-DNA-T family DNA segregation ATPase FtsK/SpoIIIE